jgi:hypothetical protein
MCPSSWRATFCMSAPPSEVVADVCGEVYGGFKEQIGFTLFFLNNNCSTV